MPERNPECRIQKSEGGVWSSERERRGRGVVCDRNCRLLPNCGLCFSGRGAMKGLKDWRAERLKMKTNVQLNEGRRRPVCFGSRPGFGEWPGGVGAGRRFRVPSSEFRVGRARRGAVDAARCSCGEGGRKLQAFQDPLRRCSGSATSSRE